MTAMTAPNGQSGGPDAGDAWAITYDSAGRVHTQTDPAGLETSYAYVGDNMTPDGGATTITDPHGNMEVDNYVDGVLDSVTKAAGTSAAATWTYTRDPSTLMPTIVTDPDGHSTTTTYDSNGNPLTVTDALGNTTTSTYNSFDEPLTVTDPLGITTTYTYDAHGNQLTKSVSAPGARTDPRRGPRPRWRAAPASRPSRAQVSPCAWLSTPRATCGQPPTPKEASPLGRRRPRCSSGALYGVSCASTSLCMAVGASGKAFYSTNPTGGTSAWPTAGTLDGTSRLNAVSCTGTDLCTFTDTTGHFFYTDDPTGGASSYWTEATTTTADNPVSLSCAATGFFTALCAAGDTTGQAMILTFDASGSSVWTTTRFTIDGSHKIASMSCPTTNLCVGGDVNGDVVYSTDPSDAVMGAWHVVTGVDGSANLMGMSCASVALCVASDDNGGALVSTNPTGTSSAWAKAKIDGSATVNAAICSDGHLVHADRRQRQRVSSTNPTGRPTGPRLRWTAPPWKPCRVRRRSCAGLRTLRATW